MCAVYSAICATVNWDFRQWLWSERRRVSRSTVRNALQHPDFNNNNTVGERHSHQEQIHDLFLGVFFHFLTKTNAWTKIILGCTITRAFQVLHFPNWLMKQREICQLQANSFNRALSSNKDIILKSFELRFKTLAQSIGTALFGNGLLKWWVWNPFYLQIILWKLFAFLCLFCSF